MMGTIFNKVKRQISVLLAILLVFTNVDVTSFAAAVIGDGWTYVNGFRYTVGKEHTDDNQEKITVTAEGVEAGVTVAGIELPDGTVEESIDGLAEAVYTVDTNGKYNFKVLVDREEIATASDIDDVAEPGSGLAIASSSVVDEDGNAVHIVHDIIRDKKHRKNVDSNTDDEEDDFEDFEEVEEENEIASMSDLPGFFAGYEEGSDEWEYALNSLSLPADDSENQAFVSLTMATESDIAVEDDEVASGSDITLPYVVDSDDEITVQSSEYEIAVVVNEISENVTTNDEEVIVSDDLSDVSVELKWRNGNSDSISLERPLHNYFECSATFDVILNVEENAYYGIGELEIRIPNIANGWYRTKSGYYAGYVCPSLDKSFSFSKDGADIILKNTAVINGTGTYANGFTLTFYSCDDASYYQKNAKLKWNGTDTEFVPEMQIDISACVQKTSDGTVMCKSNRISLNYREHVFASAHVSCSSVRKWNDQWGEAPIEYPNNEYSYAKYSIQIYDEGGIPAEFTALDVIDESKYKGTLLKVRVDGNVLDCNGEDFSSVVESANAALNESRSMNCCPRVNIDFIYAFPYVSSFDQYYISLNGLYTIKALDGSVGECEYKTSGYLSEYANPTGGSALVAAKTINSEPYFYFRIEEEEPQVKLHNLNSMVIYFEVPSDVTMKDFELRTCKKNEIDLDSDYIGDQIPRDEQTAMVDVAESLTAEGKKRYELTITPINGEKIYGYIVHPTISTTTSGASAIWMKYGFTGINNSSGISGSNSAYINIFEPVSMSTGNTFSQTVKGSYDEEYVARGTTEAGSEYRYRLQLTSGTQNATKNIIFSSDFDSDNMGYLKYVDTSDFEKIYGFTPTIYYTLASGECTMHIPEDTCFVTGISVDFGDFVLPASEQNSQESKNMYIDIVMQAYSIFGDYSHDKPSSSECYTANCTYNVHELSSEDSSWTEERLASSANCEIGSLVFASGEKIHDCESYDANGQEIDMQYHEYKYMYERMHDGSYYDWDEQHPWKDPAPVVRGGTIKYSYSVKNTSAWTLNDVVLEDIFDYRLGEIESIEFASNRNATPEYSISDVKYVEQHDCSASMYYLDAHAEFNYSFMEKVESDDDDAYSSKKLSITIPELFSNETCEFTVTVKIPETLPEDTESFITNKGTIVSANGKAVKIDTKTSWHRYLNATGLGAGQGISLGSMNFTVTNTGSKSVFLDYVRIESNLPSVLSKNNTVLYLYKFDRGMIPELSHFGGMFCVTEMVDGKEQTYIWNAEDDGTYDEGLGPMFKKVCEISATSTGELNELRGLVLSGSAENDGDSESYTYGSSGDVYILYCKSGSLEDGTSLSFSASVKAFQYRNNGTRRDDIASGACYAWNDFASTPLCKIDL